MKASQDPSQTAGERTRGPSRAVTEPDYETERRLPPGVTCASCKSGHICDQLFGAVRRAFTSCDFWPSRYRPDDIEAAIHQANAEKQP